MQGEAVFHSRLVLAVADLERRDVNLDLIKVCVGMGGWGVCHGSWESRGRGAIQRE